MNKLFKHTLLALTTISTLGISACAINDVLRAEVAARIASPAWMIKRSVDASPFTLTAFERMHERGQLATLYIEGNGETSQISSSFFDPTPHNPVGLHLASMDKANNLAYLARPCQYSGQQDPKSTCNQKTWNENQFSEETLNAYNKTLDGIKARYGVTGFNLVGYDGGATLAALLSAQRRDVKSLRTVAGRFDLTALEPALTSLKGVPQHHFIGGQDKDISPAELHAYLQAVGNSQCIDYTLIQEADHEDGWVNKWPELLKANVPQCYIAPEPEFIPIEKPKAIYSPRMGGSKK